MGFGYDDWKILVKRSTVLFLNNVGKLLLLGVIWALSLSTIVAAGPATVGFYSAVSSVVEDEKIDYWYVGRVMRKKLLPSVAYMSLLYIITFLMIINFSWYQSTTSYIPMIVA